MFELCPGEDAEEDQSATLPADTPFYVEHGFNLLAWATSYEEEEMVGFEGAMWRRAAIHPTTAFWLYLDGEALRGSRRAGVNEEGQMTVANVYEFPDGLPTGSYHLEGVWTVDASALGGELGERAVVLSCGGWLDVGLDHDGPGDIGGIEDGDG